jgi:hypothetical protein
VVQITIFAAVEGSTLASVMAARPLAPNGIMGRARNE